MDFGLTDEQRSIIEVTRAFVERELYPHEVEGVIGEVPGVEEAAVIGVPDDTGPAVVAYVRAPGLDPVEVAEAVREHCAAALAGFKRPSRVEVVDELPTTLTGRVHKGPLRLLERRRALGLLE